MDNGKTIRRVLQLKFTLPTTEPTQFVAFIKAAEPYYELFGGRAVRLLQNVDQPAQFVQIIDYEVHESLETNRQQLAGDPRLQTFLHAWRSMFPGTVEIDVFREFPEAGESEAALPYAGEGQAGRLRRSQASTEVLGAAACPLSPRAGEGRGRGRFTILSLRNFH